MRNLLYLAAILFAILSCSENKYEPRERTKEEIAIGRDKWRSEMRGGEISPEKILKARAEVRGLVERERI